MDEENDKKKNKLANKRLIFDREVKNNQESDDLEENKRKKPNFSESIKDLKIA